MAEALRACARRSHEETSHLTGFQVRGKVSRAIERYPSHMKCTRRLPPHRGSPNKSDRRDETAMTVVMTVVMTAATETYIATEHKDEGGTPVTKPSRVAIDAVGWKPSRLQTIPTNTADTTTKASPPRLYIPSAASPHIYFTATSPITPRKFTSTSTPAI
ncbi:hypothetical protein BC835DRAFT_1304257 [Cytidiella melzeri]|nr:hypothetical protein BC835DRAFT_1304257 [Cytidiella melzeri]